MNSDQPNPYASPAPAPASPAQFDPVSQKKIDAIIKDAGQFWLAIIMCVFCTGLGSIIIGPWYLVRLLQWNSIATSQPLLLDPNAPRGSIAQKFQSAKTKLIVGMSFGAVFFLLALLFVVITIATAKPH